MYGFGSRFIGLEIQRTKLAWLVLGQVMQALNQTCLLLFLDTRHCKALDCGFHLICLHHFLHLNQSRLLSPSRTVLLRVLKIIGLGHACNGSKKIPQLFSSDASSFSNGLPSPPLDWSLSSCGFHDSSLSPLLNLNSSHGFCEFISAPSLCLHFQTVHTLCTKVFRFCTQISRFHLHPRSCHSYWFHSPLFCIYLFNFAHDFAWDFEIVACLLRSSKFSRIELFG